VPTSFKPLIVLKSKQVMKRKKISNKLFSVQLLRADIETVEVVANINKNA
jgi:hypothetical protein